MATSNPNNNQSQNNAASKDVKDLVTGLRAAANEATRLARATARLEKNMDSASNAALDKAATALASLAKQSGLLEDEIKEQVKAHKHAPRELAKVIDKMERKGDALVKAQEAYTKAISDIKHHHKQSLKAAKGDRSAEVKARGHTIRATKTANKEFQKQLDDLGITAGIASKNLSALIAEAKANKASIIRASQDLAKPSAQIGKALEGMHGRVTDSIMGLGKFSVAVDLAKKAIGELWGQGIRLANKGLVGSMAQMNISAIKLRMTAEEFEALVDSNREMVTIMGGGADGIAKFEKVLSTSSVGLEYLGKEGTKAAAAMLKSFNDAGFGLMSANKDVSDAYKANLKGLNKQFKLFNAGFGDTAEQFGAMYEQLLKSESLQARLLSGDTKNVSLQMQEIMARTQTLKLMGLNNEQIVEMGKRVDAVFNPHQNRQADALNQRTAARQALLSGANEISVNSPELAAQISQFVTSGEAERFQNMRSEDKKTYQVNNAEMFKAIDKMEETLINKKDATRGDASFAAQTYMDRMAAAGAEGKLFTGPGKDLNSAEAKGNDQSAAGMVKKAAGIYQGALSDAAGETTELGKAFGRLRDAVDQTNALLNNPFTSALGAFTGAILATSTTLRTAVANVAGKMLKSATSFSSGIGGLAKKVFGGVARWILAFIADKVAGVFGLGGNKIDDDQDSSNWDNMSAWEKMQSGSARGVEKVGNFFGLENLTNQAQSDRISRESAYLKGQNRYMATQAPAVTAPRGQPQQTTATTQTAQAAFEANPNLAGYLAGVAKLETQNGAKTVKGGGVDSNNLYNIKGKTGIRAYDKAEGSNDAYRVYASRDDSTADMVNFLSSKRYAGALNAQSPEEFARILKDGGYATDPLYASKLANAIKSVQATGNYAQSSNVSLGQTPGQALGPTAQPATAAQTQAAAAASSSRQTSATNPTLDELQKHTTLLNTMVALLGKSSTSRGYQLNPQAGANVAG